MPSKELIERTAVLKMLVNVKNGGSTFSADENDLVDAALRAHNEVEGFVIEDILWVKKNDIFYKSIPTISVWYTFVKHTFS